MTLEMTKWKIWSPNWCRIPRLGLRGWLIKVISALIGEERVLLGELEPQQPQRSRWRVQGNHLNPQAIWKIFILGCRRSLRELVAGLQLVSTRKTFLRIQLLLLQLQTLFDKTILLKLRNIRTRAMTLEGLRVPSDCFSKSIETQRLWRVVKRASVDWERKLA